MVMIIYPCRITNIGHLMSQSIVSHGSGAQYDTSHGYVGRA